MAEVKKKEEIKKKRKRSSKKYPKFSLLETLKVSKAIVDNNAGQPYDRLSLAESIGLSPGNSKFRMLITASSKFGLTTGSYNAPKIALTELAVSIHKPENASEKEKALKKALFNIKFYEQIYKKYNNNKIPTKTHFKNTLEREFEIPQDDTDQCYNLIIKNAKELNIMHKISGSSYINLERSESQDTITEDTTEDLEREIDDIIEEKIESAEIEEQPIKKVISEIETKKLLKPKAFIGHSKNNKILEQLKDILDFGQFEYVIAEEVETAAIPIPEKIFGLMKECNCAIINVSADEQEKLPDDSFKINENVLIEIGASFLNYDKKVILLVDKRIELPSNLQGLYKCEYEGEELPFSLFKKLSEALKGFRN